ncbi:MULTISPECIES: hypothetical protein [unclassified Sporosarcina]|uniref:hypothetical protein n=1 Tax=unclassified Sporosarcina TaxID=2647733 RepID=UPI000A5A4A2A|nr:hypothetical protein [Sporosarcina sp. ZBG7A]
MVKVLKELSDDTYEGILYAALKRLEKRHGLLPTGSRRKAAPENLIIYPTRFLCYV